MGEADQIYSGIVNVNRCRNLTSEFCVYVDERR